MKVKVRKSFNVELKREGDRQRYSEGKILEITDEEYKLIKHQVEIVSSTKPSKE
ncbi:hypothetical protein V0288_11235 [Pannus brasiliensis CCIBt3594]|uniref:Uncharacterized protein n=1 Tax=Pannus brasiliensis CCIBt3594 TaxID=1427578 RepID=A0AAW9QW14_9CHRO